MLKNGPVPDKRAQHIGTAALYLFGIAAFVSSSAAELAFALLILALILDRRRAWTLLRTDPPTLLLGAFTAYLAAALMWAWPAEGRPADLDGAGRLLKLWLFLPVAYWLQGDSARIHRFLLCVLAGFWLGCLAAMDWTSPPAIITGERLECAISSATYFGEYAATIALGLLLYATAIDKFAARLAPSLAWPLRIGWGLAILIALAWIIASQTRAAIGGLPLALLIGLGIAAVVQKRPLTPAILSWSLAFAILSSFPIGWVIQQRWDHDAPLVATLLSGDWSTIPYTPIGIRLHMLDQGWTWWLERPLFGHGAGAVARLLDGAATELRPFKHLHNTLIDNLVRLGIVGTVLLQALFVAVFLAFWRQARHRDTPFPLVAFGFGSLIFAFLFGQADYRMGGWDWRHYWAIIGGVTYTIALATNLRPGLPQKGP